MRTVKIAPNVGSTGDTIVEVLISIAIVSLILAVSYATANHNVRSIQDAQERSQALQLAQSQVEFLRSNGSLDTQAGQVCFTRNGTPSSGDNCVVDANGSKVAGDGSVEPAYTIKTSSDATQSPPLPGTKYSVVITWDSLINSANQDNLTLYYRP